MVSASPQGLASGHTKTPASFQGPDLTSSLLGVLMRFGKESVAVMADIEAIFYQVRVNNKDTDLFRFLWWPEGDHKQEIVEYNMLDNISGSTSSPIIATFALQKCALDHKEEFGHAAETVGWLSKRRFSICPLY